MANNIVYEAFLEYTESRFDKLSKTLCHEEEESPTSFNRTYLLNISHSDFEKLGKYPDDYVSDLSHENSFYKNIVTESVFRETVNGAQRIYERIKEKTGLGDDKVYEYEISTTNKPIAFFVIRKLVL